MLHFLAAAKLRPMRRVSLSPKHFAEVRIVTDASLEALSGILLINNKAVKALATKVTETDAFQLNFTDCWKESELQGIVETMAVAIKTWTITGCRHHRRPWVCGSGAATNEIWASMR